MKQLLVLILLSSSVFAGVSREVFIRGKIGNEFNEKKVKVIDSEGQIYFIPRHYFPADLKLKQGEAFAIEVPDSELDRIKILKK